MHQGQRQFAVQSLPRRPVRRRQAGRRTIDCCYDGPIHVVFPFRWGCHRRQRRPRVAGRSPDGQRRRNAGAPIPAFPPRPRDARADRTCLDGERYQTVRQRGHHGWHQLTVMTTAVSAYNPVRADAVLDAPLSGWLTRASLGPFDPARAPWPLVPGPTVSDPGSAAIGHRAETHPAWRTSNRKRFSS